jgi:hypothetical protein
MIALVAADGRAANVLRLRPVSRSPEILLYMATHAHTLESDFRKVSVTEVLCDRLKTDHLKSYSLSGHASDRLQAGRPQADLKY